MKYLDPKADLTFKKVFGEQPDLIMSFLNALLPLKEGEEIKHIEYLTPDMAPESPLKKLSIVDVRCRDEKGRQFIVEMQMLWTKSFMQRVLFNASKAYVRQLNAQENYHLLQPVYSLALLNQNYMDDSSDYYHVYNIVCDKRTDQVIEGLHFVFVELPKFSPHTITEKKMTALWLRYLTEIGENTREAPADLLANPEVRRALTAVEESAFNDAQLLGYDSFWDAVRTENTYYTDVTERAHNEGMQQGMQQGMQLGLQQGMQQGMQKGIQQGIQQGIQLGIQEGIEQGREQGIEQGREQERQKAIEEKRNMARGMKALGMSLDDIKKLTGFTDEEINEL